MSAPSMEHLNALAIKKQCLDGTDMGLTDIVMRIGGLIVKAKARAMGKFITGRKCDVAMCEAMTPLAQRTAGAVMSPLRDRSNI